MIFNLRNATDEDLDLTYKIKKKCLQKYLEMLWGWNEETQADFHREHYQKERFQIIERQNEPIGYLEIELYEDYIFFGKLNDSATIPRSRNWKNYYGKFN